MKAHFVSKRSEYTEIIAFRKASRQNGESVSDYAMRLRHLATYCNYKTLLDKEIERQFVVSCNMEEVQRECCRQDSLELNKILDIAIGFERISQNVKNMRMNSNNNNNINYVNS